MRLRTLASDANGTRPSFVAPNFFTDTNPHRLVVTYKNAILQVYEDEIARVYKFSFPTDFVSGKPEAFILYHSLIFVPLGCLLAMMIRYQKQVSWIELIVLSSGFPSLILQGLLAIANFRNFSFKNWLLGVLFTVVAMLIVRFGLPTQKPMSKL